MKWTPIPLVRIAIIFCSGILLGVYQHEIIDLTITLMGLAFAFLAFIGGWIIRNKYLSGTAGFLCLFICGYLVVLQRTESRQPNHILYINKPIIAYDGFVQDHLYDRKNSFKTQIEIERVKTEAGWQPAIGKVNLYISKKTIQGDIRWGNRVVVMGNPSEVQPPANPNEFDFKRFLSFKNIYHQHFVQGDEVIWLGETRSDFFFYAAEARKFFSGIIKQYVPGEREQAIALALVIGVTDGVDNELENAYAASGAMHVLAVSGLHIGIIYGIILFLLKPLQRTPRGQWVVACISLFLLWSYSFVTGLSPSVLRAVTMFSFMAISRPLNIHSNIFNTLAGSAIILLLVDPFLIMSVGFQLSYLAVLGIIRLQRPLYLLWEAKTWLMDQVWQITCVSIAAQLTTFSLGLLYFHQFPTYFLFSNLFVIPISFAVLIVGIILLVVSPVAGIAKLIGWLLWGLVKLLNEGVFLVERLPYSIVNNIYVDVFQCWLIMGIVAGLVFVFQLKNIKWMYAAFSLSILLSMARWIHQYDQLNKVELIVYNIPKVSAIEVFDRGKGKLIADSALLSDSERIRFHIRPNRLFSLIAEATYTSRCNCIQSIAFNQSNVLIISKGIRGKLDIAQHDIVVVGHEAAWNVPDLLMQYPRAKFIIDSSWSRGQLKWLKKKILDQSRVYIVAESNAYISTFP